MKTLHLYIFALVFCLPVSFFAQDVHFSQYYLSPLTLNPANTGNFDGNYRFFGNYRSQWREISQAYDTYSAGGDFNFFPNNVNCSAGFIFVSDKSGGNLNITKFMPSLAIHRSFSKIKMHLGIQPGFVFKSINFNSNTFPNQLNWNTGQYDNGMPNMETGLNQRVSFFDFNAGAGLSRRIGKFEPEIGYALFHINEPLESFFSQDNRLPMRQTGNAGLTYYCNRLLIFKAYSMYGFTENVTDWVSGLNLEFVISVNPLYKNSVYTGFMWRSGLDRNPDAGIATIGLNYQKYTIGFSYDITISQLKTSVDSKGAFEIAIIFKDFNSRLIKREINCDRY